MYVTLTKSAADRIPLTFSEANLPTLPATLTTKSKELLQAISNMALMQVPCKESIQKNPDVNSRLTIILGSETTLSPLKARYKNMARITFPQSRTTAVAIRRSERIARLQSVSLSQVPRPSTAPDPATEFTTKTAAVKERQQRRRQILQNMTNSLNKA